MNAPPFLRRGTVTDLDEAMRSMDEAFDPQFGEAWTLAQCAAIMSMPGVWLTLARIGDAAAGFTLTRVIADEAELLLIAVRPAFQRRGVARALLAAAEADAAARGAAKLHLEMRADNSAGELYRVSGFATKGKRSGYYVGRDGILYDAVTLSKPISG